MADIGSSAWWGEQSDKLISFGLNALSTKGLQSGTTPNQQAEATTSVMGSNMLPYIILGVVGVAIVVIMAKR